MDNNTTPAAPAPASDATPNTNSNPAPADSTPVPAEPQTPPAPQANVPADQVEAFNKFVEANGGFDKAFGKMKQTISNPQPQRSESVPVSAQATQPQIVMGGPANSDGSTNDIYIPPKPAEGYLSANDIAKLQYNKMLSEAYSELDTEGYITKGEFVKEATSMGIPVMDQAGNMNDAAIRKFLDLKKATIPPAPASAPITATPTVTYTTVEGDITTQEQADKIMSEGSKNPQYEAALKFTRDRIFGENPEPKQK